jgi:hypothetical protein
VRGGGIAEALREAERDPCLHPALAGVGEILLPARQRDGQRLV